MNYTCSFWLKLLSASDKRLKALISYNCGSACVEIDGKSGDVWQKVTLPVYFSNEDKKSAFSSLSVAVTDFDGNYRGGQITCMYIAPGDTQTLNIEETATSNILLTPQLNSYLTLSYKNGTSQTVIAGSGTYMTQNDVMRAITSPVKRTASDGTTVYDVVTNDGKKRLANVQSLNYISSAINLLAISDTINVYFETKAPDNNNYTRQYFKPIHGGDKTQLIVTQEVKVFKNGIGTSTIDDKASSKAVWLDEYGRTKMERDSYGVLTEYTYDNEVYGKNYGLLYSKKLYASKTNGGAFEIDESKPSMLLEENKYDSNKEYMEATTDGITSQGFVYKKRFSQLESVTTGKGSDFGNMTVTGSNLTGASDGLTTKFEYNGFRDQLLKVSQTDGNTTRSNILTYDKGALRTVTDGTMKYGVINDIVSDKVDFTVFDGTTEINMLTKKTVPYSDHIGNSSTVAEYHNEADETTGTSIITLDKYGRLKSNIYSSESASGSAAFSYQSGNGESAAAGKLETITDVFEGKRYEYTYDYNNSLVSWKCRAGTSSSADNYLSVRQISAGETKYSIGKEQSGIEQCVPEKYKTQVVYDSETTIEPRIVQTANYYDSTVNDDDKDWKEISCLSNNYKYDDLGLITQKSSTANFVTLQHDYSYENITKDGETLQSPLLSNESIKQKVSGDVYAEINKTYAYDDKGRLTGVVQTESGTSTTIPNAEYGVTYTYDNFDRITQEEGTNFNGEFVVTRTYDSKGKIKTETDSRYGTTYEYSYYESGKHKGKLSSHSGTGHYDYDNYGNRIAQRDLMYVDDPIKRYEYERGNLLIRLYPSISSNDYFSYRYNHQGVRYEKNVYGETTKYYLDGAKILGEDRTDAEGNVKKLRYFYDAQGICGFSYAKGNEEPAYYAYVKDALGNIIMLSDSSNTIITRYEYNSKGECIGMSGAISAYNASGKVECSWRDYNSMSSQDGTWEKRREISEINPFRWKGFYYDEESGYYYANCRYYDPQVGLYIDADDPENILDNATVIGGLDRNAITLDNYLTVESNPFDIFTLDEMTADITYDPDENVTWWEKNWLNVLMMAIQAVIGVILLFVPGMQMSGIMMLGSVLFNALEMVLIETCPAYAKVAGGLGTVSNGCSAISTGIALLSCCNPVCWIVGTICVAVGAATVKIGINEAINGATGVNHLRERTGMSQEDYDRLYLGLNIASTVCTIAGSALRSWRGSNCFIAGTLVMTAAGLKKIEDIQVGDMVLAYDEETGEQAYKPVVRLFRNETKEWYHIHANGEDIVCTGGHPFYVVCEGFVCAKNLKVSDRLLLSDGEYAIIEEIQVEQLQTPETTYNFEVDNFHTYYVTENKVLVHNMCKVNEELSVDTVDEALDVAEQHLGPSQHYYKDGNYILVSDAEPGKIVRFDIDDAVPHVRNVGQHLNLETYAKPFGTPGQKPLKNIHLFWRKK